MTKTPQLDKLPFLYAAEADIAQKAKSGTDQRTNAWWIHLIQQYRTSTQIIQVTLFCPGTAGYT